MNFRQSWEAIINYLTDNLPADITVEAAQPGELPQKAPIVWVYLEPSSAIFYENSYRDGKQANFQIFTGTKIKAKPYLAICDSLDLMNSVIDLLSDLPYIQLNQEPLTFDGIYSDKAFFVLEGKIYYD